MLSTSLLTDIAYDFGSGLLAGPPLASSLISRSFDRDLITLATSSVLPAKTEQENSFLSNVLTPENELVKETLKVAAVGLPRTGTNTIVMALNELGFPALHTHKWYQEPEIMEMYYKNVVLPSIESETAILGHFDFSAVTRAGYTAVADSPLCFYYEQIMNEYPYSKFILMTRKSEEDWFESIQSTMSTVTHGIQVAGLFVPTLKIWSGMMRWMFAYFNDDNSVLTMPWLTDQFNKTVAIDLYEHHNQRVRQVIPQDRLLEYKVEDGWEPLCQFLEIDDCPTRPLPRANSRLFVVAEVTSAVVFFCLIVVLVPLHAFLSGLQPGLFSFAKKKKAKCD